MTDQVKYFLNQDVTASTDRSRVYGRKNDEVKVLVKKEDNIYGVEGVNGEKFYVTIDKLSMRKSEAAAEQSKPIEPTKKIRKTALRKSDPPSLF